MRQFLIQVPICGHDIVELKNRDFHYLVHVLRVQSGDTINGIDPEGTKYRLRVIQIGRKNILLRAEKNISKEIAKNSIELVLYQCVPKLPKMDTIIRMTTEVGVTRVVPIVSRFSLSNGVDVSAVIQRKLRWEKIAREAVQQSGRTTIPVVSEPCGLVAIPEISIKDSAGIFADESAKEVVPLHAVLDPAGIRNVLFVVGPEGGFDDDERLILKQKKYSPVSLGENILRTETATVCLCAAVQFLLMEKNWWISKERE